MTEEEKLPKKANTGNYHTFHFASASAVVFIKNEPMTGRACFKQFQSREEFLEFEHKNDKVGNARLNSVYLAELKQCLVSEARNVFEKSGGANAELFLCLCFYVAEGRRRDCRKIINYLKRGIKTVYMAEEEERHEGSKADEEGKGDEADESVRKDEKPRNPGDQIAQRLATARIELVQWQLFNRPTMRPFKSKSGRTFAKLYYEII